MVELLSFSVVVVNWAKFRYLLNTVDLVHWQTPMPIQMEQEYLINFTHTFTYKHVLQSMFNLSLFKERLKREKENITCMSLLRCPRLPLYPTPLSIYIQGVNELHESHHYYENDVIYIYHTEKK
mgnify:CR=1 FL=1